MQQGDMLAVVAAGIATWGMLFLLLHDWSETWRRDARRRREVVAQAHAEAMAEKWRRGHGGIITTLKEEGK